MFDNIYGIVFNCYYSTKAVVNPETYKNVFSGMTLLFNILYGLGYMYTDVVYMIYLNPTATSYWSKIGQRIGDFIMRPFYRSIPIKKPY